MACGSVRGPWSPGTASSSTRGLRSCVVKRCAGPAPPRRAVWNQARTAAVFLASARAPVRLAATAAPRARAAHCAGLHAA
eukprot:10566521-Lingulodinium_polyedra.AAC.1